MLNDEATSKIARGPVLRGMALLMLFLEYEMPIMTPRLLFLRTGLLQFFAGICECVASRILGVTQRLLGITLGFLSFAFGLQLLVVGYLPHHLLHVAGGIIGGATHL